MDTKTSTEAPVSCTSTAPALGPTMEFVILNAGRELESELEVMIGGNSLALDEKNEGIVFTQFRSNTMGFANIDSCINIAPCHAAIQG